MPRRTEELYSWDQHKTPKDVAHYMRTEGRKVGRQYATHGDVWDADPATLQIGLLHLILDNLEQMQRTDTDDLMDLHRVWLNDWHAKLTQLINSHQAQCVRLKAMFGPDVNLGRDSRNWLDIHEAFRLYRSNSERFFSAVDKLKAKVQRMKSVRKPEDVTRLAGIGPSKELKLKARNK